MLPSDVKKRVLVVDDEPGVRESLQVILNRQYEVAVAESSAQALRVLERSVDEAPLTAEVCAAERMPDLVLLDVIMPGLDGIGLLERLHTQFPKLPVIMLTASTTVKTAVTAMKIGAVDYLNKPFDVDELLSLIRETLEKGPTGRSQPSAVETFVHNRPCLAELQADFGSMVGMHPLMQELYRKISHLAARDTTILITGECGTGKELVAREIHRRSERSNGPFLALNCSAIPETLIESELFGHERGAFTHAVERRLGHFELADRGTIFLDEIGELSLPVQVKMLRFLQDQEFYRVGSSKPSNVDVRILAATNKNLENSVKDGRFRQDLYYRINVVGLEVPPLRKRVEDIPAMVDFFVRRLSTMYGGRTPLVSPQALQVLSRYSWPGNVRELENVIESILALSTSPTIELDDLPHRLRQDAANRDLKGEVLKGDLGFEDAERAFETEIIIKALKKTNFVQTKAAEMLGISRRILKYKMDKLGISDRPEGAAD